MTLPGEPSGCRASVAVQRPVVFCPFDVLELQRRSCYGGIFGWKVTFLVLLSLEFCLKHTSTEWIRVASVSHYLQIC